MAFNKTTITKQLEQFKERWMSLKEHRASQKTIKHTRIASKVIWNLFILFIVIGLMGVFFAGGVGAGYFASLVKDEPVRTYAEMKNDIYNYSETTEVYFSDNVYLGKLRSDLERDEVQLNQVSEFVKQAVIATEDEYFYEHNGVVPKAIFRAVFQEISNSDVRTGGSTLTQQLIKNQVLTNEVSFDRKAKEILLALRLERFFKKTEILEAYLNIVPFGRNASGRNIAGIQTAAKGIFGVNAQDLNLAQSAFIAGLPQSPFGYTPFTKDGTVKNNLQPGLDRMKTVLSRMKKAGYINEQQYQEALNYDITKDFAKPGASPLEKYPYLMNEVERRAIELIAKQMAAKDGLSEKKLLTDKKLYNEYKENAEISIRKNGYKIHTTINKEIYDRMQQVKNEFKYYGSDRPERKKDLETNETVKVMEPVETGAILIENSTGKIISFVGGRDHTKEQYNHATQATRQNGSTMKPLLVYAPGMEFGVVQPGSVIPDVPLTLKTGAGNWEPKNYGGGYHGLTSARYALAKSYNIPAAKTYAKIINKDPVNYLEKMGFSTITKGDRSHLSMALGGMEKGVTVEENVNAYATFANQGKFVDAYMIEKIETKEGKTIYEHQGKPTDVFTPQTAYLMIDMMRDVLKYGTAAGVNNRLTFWADWAGKSGTSQDYQDAWFVATNPNVTFGTWFGYDTPKSLEKTYKGYSYSQRTQMLWSQLINAAYEVEPKLIAPKTRFKMPSKIVRRSYCAVSGLLPSSICEELGLIESDIYNSKFVPKETDDTLQKVNYIVRGNKKYIVPETAPSEFVETGLMIKEDYLKREGLEALKELNKLIPNNSRWQNLLAPIADKLEDNGKAPAVVPSVTLTNKKMTWTQPADHDVIGYRIYQAASKNGSYRLIANAPASFLSYIVPDASAAYYVTAVDVGGKESPPSQIVTGVVPITPKPDNPPPPPTKPEPGKPGDGDPPILPPIEPPAPPEEPVDNAE